MSVAYCSVSVNVSSYHSELSLLESSLENLLKSAFLIPFLVCRITCVHGEALCAEKPCFSRLKSLNTQLIIIRESRSHVRLNSIEKHATK